MRRVAWMLLVAFAFAVPWEYSLDLGEPWGNVARIAGLILLLASVPAVLQAGRVRRPGAMQWVVLGFYLWICCTYFWSIDPAATLVKLRSYFQELMVVWLMWEFAEDPGDLRTLLQAAVAGSWVLAILTLANFSSAQAVAETRIRFAAYGQDPNDIARFLDLGFPLAAVLVTTGRSRWADRALALGYLPLAVLAVLLTASRGGLLAAAVALAGCAILLVRAHPRAALVSAMALPPLAVAIWAIVPSGTWERLSTIPEQLQGGTLNQWLNIWSAGWHAFAKAPIVGSGAGSFTSAAGLSPINTAHNTALSVAVGGGLCALLLASVIVFLAARAVLQTRGTLRLALATAFVTWAVTSLASTVEESRSTWLIFALFAFAGRLADERPRELAACFPEPGGLLTPSTCVFSPAGGSVKVRV
jgi:O-antigen ligase